MSIRILFVLAAMAFVSACNAQGLIEKYQAGQHYFVIEKPPASAAGDKVEVVEVFSYACIHCAHFEPMVQAWRRKMPANATFSYVPAAWNAQWEAFARGYYAAQALGVQEKTHEALFKAIHEERRAFNNYSDIAAWYATHGADAAKFTDTMTSLPVQSQIDRSKELVAAYGIDGTPTVIVAGKYRVTGASAGGYENVFDVVDFLVAKEAAARK